jgi:hypothetical protein
MALPLLLREFKYAEDVAMYPVPSPQPEDADREPRLDLSFSYPFA